MTKTVSHSHALRQFAVWIDHREAIIAAFQDAHLLHEEEVFSDAPPHTHGGGWSQKRLQSHRHATLEHFYKQIVQELKPADQIILYGPGQAKYELESHIQLEKTLQGKILYVVATEKLDEVALNRRAIADFKTAHIPQY